MIKRALACLLAPLRLGRTPWPQSPSDADRAQALIRQGGGLMDQKQPERAEPSPARPRPSRPRTPWRSTTWDRSRWPSKSTPRPQEAMETALKLDAASPGARCGGSGASASGLPRARLRHQKQYDKARAVYAKPWPRTPMYPGSPTTWRASAPGGGPDRRALGRALDGPRERRQVRFRAPPCPTRRRDEDLKGLWGEPVFQATLSRASGPSPTTGAEVAWRGRVRASPRATPRAP